MHPTPHKCDTNKGTAAEPAPRKQRRRARLNGLGSTTLLSPTVFNPLACAVAVSDFGPAGGPEPGVLSNRSSLVAKYRPMRITVDRRARPCTLDAASQFFFSFDLGQCSNEAPAPAEALSDRVDLRSRATTRKGLASGHLVNEDVSREQKAPAAIRRRAGQTLAG